MKKVYLLLPCTLWLSTSIGQTTFKAHNNVEFAREVETPKSIATITQKAPGVVVWQDDFSVPANWVIDNDGQSGPASGFNIDAMESSWFFNSVINSISDGNFAEVNNNGTTAPHLGVNYLLTTTAPIDITGLNGALKIDFLQYGARFRDLQEIKISTDGMNFITVGDNQNIPQLTSASGSTYTNPSLKSVYLSPFLNGSETDLWIQFSWTSAISGSTTNNDWITYGWMIDDVVLSTLADNDLSVTADTTQSVGLFYHQIPLTQVSPIDFSASVINSGQNESKNAKLTINVNSGAFTSSSTPMNLLPSVVDTFNLHVAPEYTPAAIGNYTVTRTVSSDSIDDVSINNALGDVTFKVGADIYARDNDIKQTSVVHARSGTAPNYTYEPFETGNFFDIYANQDLYALDVYFNNNGNGATGMNKEIYAKLYEYDFNQSGAASRVYKGESDLVLTNADMIPNKATLIFQAPIALEAGKTYLAMVGTESDSVAVAVAGKSFDGTSFILYKNRPEASQFFFIVGTPMVRMNFNPNVAALAENTTTVSGVSLAPNPATNTTSVNFSLKNNSEVAMTVTDMTGKVVYSMEQTTMSAGANTLNINVAEFNNGVYFVNINTNEGTVTTKLIKK